MAPAPSFGAVAPDNGSSGSISGGWVIEKYGMTKRLQLKSYTAFEEVLEDKGVISYMKKIIKYGLIAIPGLIGFYGFLQLNAMTYSQALYSTIHLYSFSTDTEEINGFIEVARWLAPVASAAFLVIIFQNIRENIKNSWRTLQNESITVYGEGLEAEMFLSHLGSKGVKGNLNKISKTRYQVIMFEDDQKALEYYCANESGLAPYSVYISLKLPYAHNMMKPNLFTFSTAENRAIIYWRNHPAKVSERIAIIGNDVLTDNILTRGLLYNIISPNQEISYHVWKKDNTYPYLHPQLDQVTMDHIFFHRKPYYKHLDKLKNMDRIILCGSDKENLEMLINLKTYFVKPNIHIAYSRKESIEAFYKDETIITFGTFQELFTREVIIKESLLEKAKTLHNDYYEKHDGDTWGELDVFKRQSNINSAEYMEQIQNLHKKNGVDSEVLAELTHICWNRLHILNNWSYGDVRNDSQRIHHLIKPYADLYEDEKQKDRDIVYKVTKG